MHDPSICEKMSARRFAQWMWYEQIEPFGELRADWRAAQIVTMIHNAAVDKEHQKEVKTFLLKFIDPKKPQTWQQQAAIARMIAMVYNAPGITE